MNAVGIFNQQEEGIKPACTDTVCQAVQIVGLQAFAVGCRKGATLIS